MKESRNVFKRLSLLGIGLCAACCLLPVAAMMFGVGALTALNAFLEWTGIITFLLAIVFFVIYYMRKKRAHACDVDCACKENE
jgi:hypothetical protein